MHVCMAVNDSSQASTVNYLMKSRAHIIMKKQAVPAVLCDQSVFIYPELVDGIATLLNLNLLSCKWIQNIYKLFEINMCEKFVIYSCAPRFRWFWETFFTALNYWWVCFSRLTFLKMMIKVNEEQVRMYREYYCMLLKSSWGVEDRWVFILKFRYF